MRPPARTREDRQTIDRIIAGNPETLEKLSDKQLIDEARKLAYRLDPHSVIDRRSRAAAERNVTLRPAPDTMTYLTALVPVEQGVAAYAALTRTADTLRSTGDERSRGQAMADTLVERLTGQAAATDVGVDVRVVITDRALFAGDHEPALLEGHGIVPASWARDLVADAIEGLRAWFHRLYTAPGTGDLVALDSRARTAPAGLASFIRTRDQRCRTPWCDAPIRHIDHIRDHADHGKTRAFNLDGLCEACNHAKTAIGWQARPRPGPRHTIETTTPTGHTYRSRAPALPGTDDGHSVPELTAPRGPSRQLRRGGLGRTRLGRQQLVGAVAPRPGRRLAAPAHGGERSGGGVGDAVGVLDDVVAAQQHRAARAEHDVGVLEGADVRHAGTSH